MANKIAAGEVVERPASVVKELLENSIDAGATRIIIDIETAGKDLIRVSDNGMGMSAEDVKLAFHRHATSKIRRPDDLAAIQSLGFRGEALPSIASIARVRLFSSNDESRPGTEISIEGGEVGFVKETACPRGTTLEVRQLFYNTPARKKFLKGDSTEFSHITQMVTQQALSHPGIHMTLNHNGRQIINALPTEHAIYRIAELFGAELARELVEVKAQAGDYLMRGYISSPVYTRSNRSAQYFFVNRRLIRDKVILHATQLGYSRLLPRNEHPVIFLYLSMDPHLLDVNVHPAKAEVRFAHQQEVHHFVSEGIKKALTGNERPGEVPEKKDEPARIPSLSGPTVANKSENFEVSPPPTYSREQHGEFSRGIESLYKGAAPSPEKPGQHGIFDRKPTPLSSFIYSEFEPLGQLNNSFIVLQGKRGVLIVDQHIAHERILYERFSSAAKDKKIEVQQLMFPQAVEFSASEAQLVTAHLEMLNGLGMELEPFGSNGFLLRAVPAILKGDDHERLLRDIVESLSRQEKVYTLEEKYDEMVTMMSCRNAIKINQPLNMDQIKKLLFDLEQTQMPYTCPHGRPITLLFEMDDILKRFLRK
jgi:DNA mismatch repair protein MutL